MSLLELRNITAGYGKNIILKDLNLNVEKGELVSLLGSSGCGKTTTLRLIGGFSEPTSMSALRVTRKRHFSCTFSLPKMRAA